ncbi:cytochrome P450 2U1-like [Limulus polyphemus]|uniref:Cytochrome P450 2U1-like n=1 Tax=Limulus polyphemus TaxID=6850 RepID=A0ABM1B3R8_LIMPO|nr:cytochrome P450 2U1-like [Limulus polyphemus]
MLTYILNWISLPVLLITTAAGLLIVYYLERPKNLAPGPIGFPLVGYLPFLGPQPHVTLFNLAKRYGDILSFTVWGKTFIHLNSYSVILDAYLEHGDMFAGRPQDFSFFWWLTDGLGIVQSEGKIWQEHRRFALKTLRDFGFGKLSLEGRVLEIAKDILNALKQTYETPYDMSNLLANSTTNVICSLMFDKHYNYQDPEFLKARSLTQRFFLLLPGINAFIPRPFARYVPWSLLSKDYRDFAAVKKEFYEMMDEFIKEHQETFNETCLRDYTDVYLDTMRKADSSESFSLERLKAIGLNMFLAGTETTSNTLYWGMKLMTLHREIQDRVYKEIVEVVGKERFPSMVDRYNMPYTEATLMELQRFANISPLSIFHCNPVETTLRGYTIPKRSVILANLWNVHRDPIHWPNPDKFDPLRFLDQDGKVIKREGFIPFSVGKCIYISQKKKSNHQKYQRIE